jgi:uncharacterized membrane protein
MGWLFMGPALFGVWRYRYFAYWQWVLWAGAVLIAAGFLFSAGGTVSDPTGDGLITLMVRRASNDGPEVLWLLLGFAAAIAVCFPLLQRAHLATKLPHPGRDAAKSAGIPRKIAESVGLFVAVFAINSLMGAVLYTLTSSPARAVAAIPQTEAPSLESQLDEVVQTINGQADQRLDDITVWTGARREGLTVVYEYTLDTDADRDRVRSLMSRQVTPMACVDAGLRADMSRGVVYRYEYRTQRDEAVSFDVTEGVCARADARATQAAP